MRVSRSSLRSWGVALLFLSAFAAIGAGQPASEIDALIASGTLEEMRWPDFAGYRSGLRSFYQPTGDVPAWIKGTYPGPQALCLIELFRDAGKKGLDPEDYDSSRWDGRIRALADPADVGEPARFDVALTVSVMRYVSDLRIGRLPPGSFEPGTGADFDVARFLRSRIVGAANPQKAFEELEPPFPAYRRTEQALARYVELAAADDGEKLPAVKKAVSEGDSWDGVPRLARLLRLVGDLPADAAPAGSDRTYRGPLVDAVKRFQRRHGLDDDGRLGPATIERLNVPLRDRVLQLRLTLERFRWLPTEFPAPPVIVNIPDFRLRALDESYRVALEMRVVVGKAMRSNTPVFTREMTHVIFRPYWNVPRSILVNEVLPEIRKDRGEMARNRYEVTTPDGQVVATGRVSDDVLLRLRAGKLMLRQAPGRSNSMGLVKLMFPNEYAVYLHGTPSTEIFSRSRRDFSHGCIRVEKPAELAAWVLRHNPGWTPERVREAMQNGKNDVIVNLARHVPVFVVYATAIGGEGGEVRFYDDIYGHDAVLAAALARGCPYP